MLEQGSSEFREIENNAKSDICVCCLGRYCFRLKRLKKKWPILGDSMDFKQQEITVQILFVFMLLELKLK
jgi:hypothetical protein